MGKYISEYTSFLFARSSFLEGLARSIDLGATLQEFNYSSVPQLADSRALYSDWRAIGDDLLKAISEISELEKIKINDELLEQAYAILDTKISDSFPALLASTEK